MTAKRFFVAMLIAFGALAWAALDRSPAIPVSKADASAASAARALFDRLRNAGPGFQAITANQDELAAAATIAGRAAGFDRTKSGIEQGAMVSRASVALPLGLWLNPQARIIAGDGGEAILSGTIGDVPVPPWLAEVGLWALRLRIGIPALDDLVRKLTIGRDAVSAEVQIPRNGAALAAVASPNLIPIDGSATAAAYCRILATQREGAISDLPALTRAAFAQGGARENLVALAMAAVSPKVARLAGPGVEAASRCGVPTELVTLHGRPDLAKHWSLSAALTAAFGPDASDVAGVWKELSDSATGGSGFSYVDLAADRAGTLTAVRLSDPQSAPRTAAWLAKTSEQDLLPISQLALAEGMSEAAFARRYGSIDGARHQGTVRRIDSVILRNLPR